MLAQIELSPARPTLLPSSQRPCQPSASGPRLRTLRQVSDKDIKTAGHLGSSAVLAPVIWPSGNSIRGDHSSYKGDKVLGCVCLPSPFTSLNDSVSRNDNGGKRADGKRNNQVLVALARRHYNVQLRDETVYQERVTLAA